MLPPLQPSDARDAPPATGPPRDALRHQQIPSHQPQHHRPSAPRRVSIAKPAATASPRRSTVFHPTSSPTVAQPLPPASTAATATAIESVSRIPREFFVLETSAVLQYPPTQYQSTLHLGSGLWETVVFPALTPHTRQQVLYLQQTLAAMRRQLTASAGSATWADAVAYTEREWSLHALCFHELARQIQCICREQSELLREVQQVYDAAIARMLALARTADAERLRAEQDAATATAALAAERQCRELQQHQQQQQRDEAERQRQQQPTAVSGRCSCGRQRSRRRGKRVDPAEDSEEDDGQDEDEGDENEHERFLAWRRIQRRRRQRLAREDSDEDGGDSGEDPDDDGEDGEDEDDDAGCRRRARRPRASVVEENEAAARVQLAYQKYQSRKEANRQLQRREKHNAALDIQRSYRGYRERQQALHHRAVATLIGRRRQQVAAVELLQANVRAYLVKKRRELRHRRESVAAAQRSMLEAQREEIAPTAATAAAATPPATGEMVMMALQSGGMTADRFTHLVNRMSELATAFTFLHSRRLQAKRQGQPPRRAEVAIVADESRQQTAQATEHSETKPADDEDRELLSETIRRAEDLAQSFRTVISELKHDAALECEDALLTKATSTSSLPDVALPIDASHCEDREQHASTASFLFVDDAAPAPQRPGLATTTAAAADFHSQSHASVDGEEDPDDTHLDDVLWQASAFTIAPPLDEREDEATARQLLTQELLASREQLKRYAQLKQLIADVYDTVVGRLAALPRVRLDQLIKVHASLALSFADADRVLQRHSSTSEYEPVTAFVGRVALAELVRDHFHCRLGLQHLVDAAVQRSLQDAREFVALDADVQRFLDFYTLERPPDELVFFCLCRLLAQRHPAFHRDSLHEVLAVDHGVALARVLFHVRDEAAMIQADAVLIEPTNEIYVKHLPSHGVAQVEAILKQLAAHRCSSASDGRNLARLLRASNAGQFHATPYSATAPRSPVRGGGLDDDSVVEFGELVDLLRRYRRVMRHFHAFIRWTHALFLEAHRRQRQQQALDERVSLLLPIATTPLLEEAWFVASVLPFSLGAGERELRNVFHNALKQRHLQRFMPVRVFVSLVLVLLRNGVLSVTSYRPLQPAATSGGSSSRALVAGPRHQREEKRWVHLALQWRTQEQRFEQAVERLYMDGDGAPDSLLQWRNELYDLFVHRAGRESLERAEELLEQLVAAVDGALSRPPPLVGEGAAIASEDRTLLPPPPVADGLLNFTGTPWGTDEDG